MPEDRDDRMWRRLKKKYPQVFLEDPFERLDPVDDPSFRPIREFVPEDEREEFDAYMAYLEEEQKAGRVVSF